mmetsp:Transcript_22262/g.42516  ORF Transcript_22262/g.42516 Transcript_22262/m.42516 type:complete len:251 (-) Transcript_22262:4-756(-)
MYYRPEHFVFHGQAGVLRGQKQAVGLCGDTLYKWVMDVVHTCSLLTVDISWISFLTGPICIRPKMHHCRFRLIPFAAWILVTKTGGKALFPGATRHIRNLHAALNFKLHASNMAAIIENALCASNMAAVIKDARCASNMAAVIESAGCAVCGSHVMARGGAIGKGADFFPAELALLIIGWAKWRFSGTKARRRLKGSHFASVNSPFFGAASGSLPGQFEPGRSWGISQRPKMCTVKTHPHMCTRAATARV